MSSDGNETGISQDLETLFIVLKSKTNTKLSGDGLFLSLGVKKCLNPRLAILLFSGVFEVANSNSCVLHANRTLRRKLFSCCIQILATLELFADYSVC